jgi:hypothetical protein
MPLLENLANGFEPGSSLYLELRMPETSDSFSVNLQLGKLVGSTGGRDISLHFNPRFDVTISLEHKKYYLKALL